MKVPAFARIPRDATIAGALLVSALIWLPAASDLLWGSGPVEARRNTIARAPTSTRSLETRPLFHVSRRPLRSPDAQIALELPKAFEHRHALRGIVETDDGAVGIFERVDLESSVRMRTGETLENHRLVAIDAFSARFETPLGQTVTVVRRPSP